MGRHVYLRFTFASEETRYQFLYRKCFQDDHHLDWHLITLGVRDWLVECLPIQWCRILTTTSLQYRELTLEFHTTYEVATGISDIDAQTISYCMRGLIYAMSLSEFIMHMSIYTEDKLPRWIRSRVSISNLERAKLWHQVITMGLYDAFTYKASNIHDPRILILHRLITIAFYGRLESVGNVTHGDLNIINALLNSHFLCPARMLAENY